jgi:hypothetical protein
MRKRSKILVLSLVMLITIVGSVPVQAEKLDNQPEITKVTLSEKQKKELAKQYKEILKREQKVIATYVEYGVITEQQGKVIAAHLDKRYTKLEQSGFIPHWGKHKEHHNHKHKN